MAIFEPELTPCYLLSHHRGEIDTLLQLKDILPDTFRVFHSVNWSEPSCGKKRGEIDFVIVDEFANVLVIEQKNGLLNQEGGKLSKYYCNSQKGTDVGEQILTSMDKVLNKFNKYYKGDILFSKKIDYLIYCPDYKIVNFNAAGLERNHIVDATQKKELASIIQKLTKKETVKDKPFRKLIINFFRQSFSLVPDIHQFKDSQTKMYIKINTGLSKLVSRLEMQPFKLAIKGTAGCGKTLAAQVFHDKQLENGQKVLLLCFNRPLADKFQAIVQVGSMVNTWNGFCTDYLETIGHTLDYSKMDSDPHFWQDIDELILNSVIPENWKFDTLIIDEGQDFHQEWLDTLQLFLTEDASTLWLEATDQNIMGADHTLEHSDFVTYNSSENFRNPQSIAHFIQETLDKDFEVMNPLPGLGVGMSTYSSDNEQLEKLKTTIKRLLSDGFKHEDIILLSYHGMKSSSLSDLDSINKIPIKKFTGKYDKQKNQIMTEGTILFESIYRFKGQQAPVVIFVDIDPTDECEHAKQILFTGMTRATVRLELLAKKGSAYSHRFLKFAHNIENR
jgi:hypothetical protein